MSFYDRYLNTPGRKSRAALLLAIVLVLGINLIGELTMRIVRPSPPPPPPVVAKAPPAEVKPAPAPEPPAPPPQPAEVKPEPAPPPAPPKPAVTDTGRALPKTEPMKAPPPPPPPKAEPLPAPLSASAELAKRLKNGNAVNGAKLSPRCAACHGFDVGGRHRIGPNLYDIVGGAKASRPGFAYSPAMKGLGGQWDYDALDAYLASPANFAPGNKMVFTGVPDPAERADIILFLRNLSGAPKPLP